MSWKQMIRCEIMKMGRKLVVLPTNLFDKIKIFPLPGIIQRELRDFRFFFAFTFYILLLLDIDEFLPFECHLIH